MLTALGVAQIPLLAAMLIGGCSAKFVRVVQRRSIDAGLGPTALFPLRLRPWAAGTLCAVELGLGIGLIVTAGTLGAGAPAKLVRVGTCVLFVVATCALIELRSIRPDIGCGCFGDFSSTPITARTLLRSSLLAVAALGTVEVAPIRPPHSFDDVALTLIFLLAELAIFGLLSPEFRDVLVRIGYSEPCELRVQGPEQTLATLQRTSQWRRNAALIVNDQPLDVWRELCWRYLAFPSRYNGRETELVFAVYLQTRRPIVLAALVDASTGVVIPSPVSSPRTVGWRPARLLRRGAHAAPQPTSPTWLSDELAQGRLNNPDQLSGEPSEAVGNPAV
jgi:hypothetical protein